MRYRFTPSLTVCLTELLVRQAGGAGGENAAYLGGIGHYPGISTNTDLGSDMSRSRLVLVCLALVFILLSWWGVVSARSGLTIRSLDQEGGADGVDGP